MAEILGKSYSLTTLKNYCRLVGFFPYDLIQDGDGLSVKFSLKYMAWSHFLGTSLIVLGTVCVAWSFFSLDYWFSPAYIDDVMTIYIVHLNFLFNIVGAFICIVYTTFSRRMLNDFINNIMKADKLLAELRIPARKNRWSKVMALSIVTATIIVVMADSVSYYFTFEESLFISHALRKLPYFSSYFFSLAQTYMFWSLVLLVRARICAIKESFSGFDGAFRFESRIMVKEFESVLLQQRKTGSTDFKRLQKVYIHLFDAARALDELFRPIIVLSFLTRFFALLVTPFILYVQITGYGNYIFILSQTLWAFGQFSSLALMIEPASYCRKEYDDLKLELSRVVCDGTVFDGDLELLFDLVKALPIQFYINDATPLKRTLYVSVLGCLTTYLVVLFQMTNK